MDLCKFGFLLSFDLLLDSQLIWNQMSSHVFGS